MSIPGGAPSLFLAAAAGAAAGFSIDRSLRFNSADSAYLNRTPSSAGDRRKFTWSGWVKRAKLGEGGSYYPRLFATARSTGKCEFNFMNDDTLRLELSVGQAVTSQVFRDCSSFYHIVLAVDTTLGSNNDRIKMYVNGTRITEFSSYPTISQNFETGVNTTQSHVIGRYEHSSGEYFDGYLCEVNFIDGSGLDPTSFGEFDDNNVWQPKDTSSLTFGTNGFRLKFNDNSSNSALGTDSSGNGNSWSVNNFNASSGSTLSPSVYGAFASGSLAGAFDGSTASGNRVGVRPNASGVSFTAQTVNTKLRVYCGVESGQGTLYINKTINTSQAPSRSSPSYVDVTSNLGTLPFTLTDVGFHGGSSGAGADIYAIEVDNTVLVNSEFISDSLVDTPTNGDTANDTGAGGEITGNYCTFNPLKKSAGATLSDGNLDVVISGTGGTQQTFANFGMSSGKWFWEVKAVSGTARFVGIAKDSVGLDKAPGETADTYAFGRYDAGAGLKWNNDSSTSYGTHPSIGDVVGVAFDADNGTLTFYLNGVSQGTAFTGISGTYFPVVGIDNTGHTLNAGQRSFAHSAPSGFSPLATSFLPDPTIADGSDFFEARTYNGDTTTSQSGFEFSPDFLWLKSRNNNDTHFLFDTVRGATKYLSTTSTSAEGTQSASITSFDSNGFSYGSWGPINNTSMIAWCWDAASSTATNTDGTITSYVRANQTAGFSIITYTGNGSTNQTIGHGLNSKPSLIIIKSRDQAKNWVTIPAFINDGYFFYLNDTSELLTFLTSYYGTHTSSVVGITGSASGGNSNASGKDYLCLAFAPVEGYSKISEYTSTGTNNFVFTGFRPAFLIAKRVVATGDNSYEGWVMFDSKRGAFNINSESLYANKNQSEGKRGNDTAAGSTFGVDFLSNGFCFKDNATEYNRADSGQYIYYCVAEHPFKTARAR